MSELANLDIDPEGVAIPLACDELRPLQAHANAALPALLSVLAAGAVNAVGLREVVPAVHQRGPLMPQLFLSCACNTSKTSFILQGPTSMVLW